MNYAAALAKCSDLATQEFFDEARGWHDEVLSVLKEEAYDCLNTDPDINQMIETLPHTLYTARVCIGRRQWELLNELAANVESLSWGLRYALDSIEERHGTSATEDPRNAAPRPDAESDAGEEDEAIAKESRGTPQG